jgi:hypothetical protein
MRRVGLATGRSLLHLVGLTVMTVVLLAGCGGHGGGATQPSFVGTYVGTSDLTVSHPPISVSEHGAAIQFVVSPDNTVSVGDPGKPPFGTGTLSGNTFVATAPASVGNGPGVTCSSGSINFNGTISGTTINGTISSSGVICNGLSFDITGTFTATLRAEIPARGVGAGITQTLIQTLRDAVRSQ